MKYARLTKEQFDELHTEFANFLASQSIDKKKWDELKSEKPEVAEQELDIFSDLIWEGVLNRAEFLEHFSKNYIFLFRCSDLVIHSIVVKSLDPEIDFLSRSGIEWLGDNLFTETVEMKVGQKPFGQQRNESLFGLIQQGAFLTDGQLFKQIDAALNA